MRSNKLISRYVNEVQQQVEFTDEIIVIASYVPLEAVAALEIIKKKNSLIKTVYYSADTLSNEEGNSSILSSKMRESMGIRWEKRLFMYCDLILIMECHKEHYFADKYSLYKNKMKIVSFPLLVKSCDVVLNEKDDQTFVYAGTLYRKLRNPYFACNVMSDVLKSMPYKLLFLGRGDCNDILDSANRLSCGKIQNLGMKPHEVASDYINSARVLVSIGNYKSLMMPSKIYEYMSTGKPIIHFYTCDHDSCLEPLRQYGNSLLIKENSIDAVSKIKNFVNEAKDLEYVDVKRIFEKSTPKFSADLLKEISGEYWR